MKQLVLILSFLFFSQLAIAQLQPVLFDSDDRPIGNIIGFGAAVGIEYVDLVSLKGYRAKMSYRTADHSPPQTEGNDLPGYSAKEYFESTDCTGDPVMLPTLLIDTPAVLEEDFSNAIDFLSIGKLWTAGLDKYQPGDMFEFSGASYYVPYGAALTTIEAHSVFFGICQLIDRCSLESWEYFGKLNTFDGEEKCPNLHLAGRADISTPKFTASGYAFSAIKPNDPAVTGFQSIKYKQPYRIKYLDINKIFINGFEVKAE